MKLTDKKLAEFFPRDNRFIHFCAKRYKYSFWSDETVEDARYYSLLNVMRYFRKNGNDFEDEAAIIAFVMTCIRYGILSAFSDRDNRKKRIDLRYESEFIMTGDDSSEYNFFESKLGVEDTFSDTHYTDLLDHLREHTLTERQNKVLQECLIDGKTMREFSVEHNVPQSTVESEKRKIRLRFKKLIEQEDESKVSSNKECVPQVKRGVRKSNGSEPFVGYEEKEYSYLKAMSFLYS